MPGSAPGISRKLPAYANSVATSTFNGTASNLGVFGSYSTPTPQLACNGITAVCNVSNASTSYVTTPATYNCPSPSSPQYCVVVTATVSTSNMIVGQLVPTSVLTVTGVGQQGLSTAINGTNVPPSPGFGAAGDVSGIYAYAVPMNGTGTNANPEFDQVPAANTGCTGYSSIGPLALTGLVSTGSSTCNYLFIALSTQAGTGNAGGSITLQDNQPIAFTFVNYTGADGYHNTGNPYTTSTNLNIKVGNGSTSYYANGMSVNTYTTTTTTYTCEHNGNGTQNTAYYNQTGSQPYQCNAGNIVTNTNSSTSATGTVSSSSSCTSPFTNGTKNYCEVNTSIVVTVAATTITGSCPDHTLYGSLRLLSA